MADLPTIGGAGLVGTLGAFLGHFVAGLLSGKKEPSRDTALPPAPPTPQPSLHECAGCASLRGTVEAMRGDMQRLLASDNDDRKAREDIRVTLAEMKADATARREERAARARGGHGERPTGA
jgi:hypothetical protein